MIEWIFLILMSFTPHHLDTETWSERQDRMMQIAVSIDDATLKATCQGKYANKKDSDEKPDEKKCVRIWPNSRKLLAASIISIGLFESHFAEHVHENRCRLEKGECDSHRVWKPRKKSYVYYQKAFSPWQLQFFRDMPAGHQIEIKKGGELGTRLAAWHATRRFSSAYRACGGSLVGAYGRYGRGNGCYPTESSPKRVAKTNQLLKKTQWELQRSIDRHQEIVKEKRPEINEENEDSEEKRVASNDHR